MKVKSSSEPSIGQRLTLEKKDAWMRIISPCSKSIRKQNGLRQWFTHQITSILQSVLMTIWFIFLIPRLIMRRKLLEKVENAQVIVHSLLLWIGLKTPNISDQYVEHTNFCSLMLVERMSRGIHLELQTLLKQFGQIKHANLDGMSKESSHQDAMDLTSTQLPWPKIKNWLPQVMIMVLFAYTETLSSKVTNQENTEATQNTLPPLHSLQTTNICSLLVVKTRLAFNGS